MKEINSSWLSYSPTELIFGIGEFSNIHLHISKYNSKSKFIISMETTSNSEIFKEGVTKTKDGRTRKQREDQGEISNISDITPGTELKK